MGCGVSRLDANGMAIPARLRPIFLQRLEEIKLRRQNRHLNADSTPSKKELLLHAMDDDDNASHHQHTPCASKSVPSTPKKGEIYGKENGIVANINNNNKDDVVAKESNSIGKGKNDPKESAIEGAKANMKDEDDDGDGNERMIGHEDDDAFPGSPSFRVYFKDINGEDDHIDDNGKRDAFKDAVSSDDGISPMESCVDNKEVKRSGRKKRSFRKVLPKGGQVKNLLNVKSCYTPSHDHHHPHLLTAKTAT